MPKSPHFFHSNMDLRTRYVSDALICVKASGGVVLCLRSSLTPEEVRAISAKGAGEAVLDGRRWRALRPLPPSIDTLAKDILELEDDGLRSALQNKLLDIVLKEQLKQDFSWTAIAEGKADPFQMKKGMVAVMIVIAIKHIVDREGIGPEAFWHGGGNDPNNPLCSCWCSSPNRRCWLCIGERNFSCFHCYKNEHISETCDVHEVRKMYVRMLVHAIVRDIVKRKNGGSIASASLKGSMSVVEVCMSTFYIKIQDYYITHSLREAYKRGLEGVIAKKHLEKHARYTIFCGRYDPSVYNLMMEDSSENEVE